MEASRCEGRRGLILLVDDREHSREFLSEELAARGYQVHEAEDGLAGWEYFCLHHVDLVISDLRMPRADGMELLRRIRSVESPRPQIPVLLLSAYGTLPIANDAGRAGATAFYAYNDDGIESVLAMVPELINEKRMSWPPELVGQSAEAVQLRSKLASLAKLPSAVLLIGEPGADTESIARALHQMSALAALPFHRVQREDSPSSWITDICVNNAIVSAKKGEVPIGGYIFEGGEGIL